MQVSFFYLPKQWSAVAGRRPLRGTFYNHILRNKKENKRYQFRQTELSERIRKIYNESNQICGGRIKVRSATR